MSHGNVGSKSSDGSGRGRSAASASLLAAKAELLGTLDAMLSEDWEAAHPVEVAERRRFVDGVLAKSSSGREGRLGLPRLVEGELCGRGFEPTPCCD